MFPSATVCAGSSAVFPTARWQCMAVGEIVRRPSAPRNSHVLSRLFNAAQDFAHVWKAVRLLTSIPATDFATSTITAEGFSGGCNSVAALIVGTLALFTRGRAVICRVLRRKDTLREPIKRSRGSESAKYVSTHAVTTAKITPKRRATGLEPRRKTI